MAVALIVLLWTGDEAERRRAVGLKLGATVLVLLGGVIPVWVASAGATHLPTWNRIFPAAAVVIVPAIRYWPDWEPGINAIGMSLTGTASQHIRRLRTAQPVVVASASVCIAEAIVAFLALGYIGVLPTFVQVLVGASFGLMSWTLSRAILQTPRASTLGRRLGHEIPRILIAFVAALLLAETLSLAIFNKEVVTRLQARGMSDVSFINRISEFGRLRAENTRVSVMSWLLTLLLIAIWCLPSLLRIVAAPVRIDTRPPGFD